MGLLRLAFARKPRLSIFISGVFVGVVVLLIVQFFSDHRISCWRKQGFGFTCSTPSKESKIVQQDVPPTVDTVPTQQPQLSAGPYDSSFVVDERCAFQILDERPWVVLSNETTAVLELKENVKYGLNAQLSQWSASVTYLPLRERAVVSGGTFDLLYLLDFSDCTSKVLADGAVLTEDPTFEFNADYFRQSVKGISPDGKYLAFFISEGNIAPHFPGTGKDFSTRDGNLIGVWIFDFAKNRAVQVFQHDPIDAQVQWVGHYDLSVVGSESCVSGCTYDPQQLLR